jgi:hypothetical protein
MNNSLVETTVYLPPSTPPLKVDIQTDLKLKFFLSPSFNKNLSSMSPNLIFLALFQSFFKRIQKGQIYSYHLYVYLTPLKYICKANLRLFSVTYQKVVHWILTFINPVNSIDDNQVHKNIDLNPPFMSTNPSLSVRNHQFRTLILHVFANLEHSK